MSTKGNRILVLAETENGKVEPLTFELLAVGKALADSCQQILCALVLGKHMESVALEIADYVDETYVLDHSLLEKYQADLYVAALEEVCRILKPVSFLMGHTYNNQETAPRLACRAESGLVTDCIKVERDPETGHLLCTKSVYGGHAHAVFELDTRPELVLLRQKVYAPASKGTSKGRIMPLECEIDPELARNETIEVVMEESLHLDQAEVIVSAGRGVQTAEGVGEVQKLIKALEKYFEQVELGASRPLVDANILPRTRQVGQTGERVSPELYIAVGISGAVQHVRGMTGSKKIVAVNSDPEAPIFHMADYGVVGPYEKVIPAMIKQLEDFS
jgi:electron transfer flavoprotein alpha subunit